MRYVLGLALWAGGCTGSGNDPDLGAELSVTPEILDFGLVGVGEQVPLEITVANVGGGSIDVLSVNLTEGDSDAWSVDRTGLGGTLSASEAGVVVVTFSPEDNLLNYTGTVQIRTDDATTPSLVVSLVGQGGESTADDDGDGVSVAEGDCDDGNADVYPGAEEICDGVDNNCDGIQLPDEVDEDGDGSLVCAGDCNDDNSDIYPGAPEICDGFDNDCDGVNADNDDLDGDGFSICAYPEGDCNDNEPSAFPGGIEVCADGIDNDCDGGIDDIDADGDGHSLCSVPGDCLDNDATAHPVVVDANAGTGGDGTEADPYDSITTALANLDSVCRMVVLEAGTHIDVDEVWDADEVTVIGRTGDPADVVLEAAADTRHFQVTGGAILRLQDLTLAAGDTTVAGLDGGSVSVSNATLTLGDVVAQGNVAGADGGAIAVSSGTLELTDGCVFDGNAAGDDGGAIAMSASVLLDSGGTLYQGNSGTIGGAIFSVGGTVDLSDAELQSNVADEGGALAVSGAGTYALQRNWIHSNEAALDGGGVALRDADAGGSEITNNRIMDNIAQGGGGGVAIVGATAVFTLANNTLTGNEAVTGQGGGILVDSASASGATIAGNVLHSCNGNSAFEVNSVSAPLSIYNTVFGTNSGVHFAGIVGDGTGSPLDPTNQVRDPLLVGFSDDLDPSNDDLTLQAGSLEIDSGPPIAVFNDVDGTTNDRGYTGGPAAN